MSFEESYIVGRLHSLVDSRFAAIEREVVPIRAKYPLSESAQGRGIGELACRHCEAALDVLTREYLLYCKQEWTDPTEHIGLLQNEIDWFISQLTTKFGRFGGPQLFESYLAQFRKDTDGVYKAAMTGRLHGEQLYRHRPLWKVRAQEWFTLGGSAVGYLVGIAKAYELISGKH
ncbi:MAG: hypothetical protein EPO08_02865 [Rhodospirillaceae bacterium]|nr:MAG: hypothetical protein EPO08_02865 [Rhodospirillaceae bacterium]